ALHRCPLVPDLAFAPWPADFSCQALLADSDSPRARSYQSPPKHAEPGALLRQNQENRPGLHLHFDAARIVAGAALLLDLRAILFCSSARKSTQSARWRQARQAPRTLHGIEALGSPRFASAASRPVRVIVPALPGAP